MSKISQFLYCWSDYERLDARHIFKNYGLQPKSFSENGPAEGWRGGGTQGAQDCSQFEVTYHDELTVKHKNKTCFVFV